MEKEKDLSVDGETPWDFVERELEEMFQRYRKAFKFKKGLTTKSNLHYFIFNSIEWD